MANDRDELMRLAAEWRTRADEIGEDSIVDMTHSLKLRDCAQELEDALRALAQRAPQNGAVPEALSMPQMTAGVDVSLERAYRDGWNGCRMALLAAAPAPEADSCAVRFCGVDYGKPGGDKTVRMAIENGRVTSIEELEPEAERAKGACPKCGKVGVICKTPDCAMLTRPEAEGDVFEAYKTWPDDIRKKLSAYDLRRMGGWAPKTAVGDWRIDTSAGRPILVYQNCSVIEAETATYVLGLIARDAPPPAGQPEGERADDETVSGVIVDRDARGLIDKVYVVKGGRKELHATNPEYVVDNRTPKACCEMRSGIGSCAKNTWILISPTGSLKFWMPRWTP